MTNQNKPKSRVTAFLLATFLGMFGAHRFYLGRTGTAVFQLILTLTLVGAIVSSVWVLIDWIRLIIGTFEDADGNTLEEWK